MMVIIGEFEGMIGMGFIVGLRGCFGAVRVILGIICVVGVCPFGGIIQIGVGNAGIEI